MEDTSDGSDESDSLSESHSHTQNESARLAEDDSESDLDEDAVQAAAEAVTHASRCSETTDDEKAYKVVEAVYTSYEMQRKMAGSLKGSMSLRERMASFTER